MSHENPGAYDEARKRIREKKEMEVSVIEVKKEDFEKGKEKLRKRKWLDAFELKRHIETGKSLSGLKNDIENALKEWSISFETYEKTIRALTEKWDESDDTPGSIEFDTTKLPFSANALAQYLEDKKWWENPLVDLLGVCYGFFVQWSALMVILIWNMLLDILKLPRDIYREFTTWK